MSNVEIGTTKTGKDLGVSFSYNLKVSLQFGIAALKANGILGLMKTNIEYKGKVYCLSI